MDDSKILALTFDDGPNEPYTSQIIDFLNSVGVCATFFQVGKAIRRYPDVTKKAFDSGHVIGNHSYSHSLGMYIDRKNMVDEIESTERLTRSLIGKTPRLYRAPWFLHTPMMKRIAAERSLTLVRGKLPHAGEIFQPGSNSIARHALARSGPGAILIFHDGYRSKTGYRGSTVEAVKIVVNQLLARGYGFVTVDKLLGVPAYRE